MSGPVVKAAPAGAFLPHGMTGSVDVSHPLQFRHLSVSRPTWIGGEFYRVAEAEEGAGSAGRSPFGGETLPICRATTPTTFSGMET